MAIFIWADINQLDPPHKVSRPDQVIDLANKLLLGWDKSKPVLIGYKLGNRIQLLSGSHRLPASKLANLNKLPVRLFDYHEIAKSWGNLDLWEIIMDEVPLKRYL